MPGKVNPVIPEVLLQVAAQVIGNDTAITIGGQAGSFELNTMLPLIAYNLLQSIELLASAVKVFAKKCVDGITANEEKCASTVDKSIALVTPLVPIIGYDKAAAIAKEARETGKTIREIALEKKILPEVEIDRLLRDKGNI
jgi:fumarate hydratase class II